jgi:serine protease
MRLVVILAAALSASNPAQAADFVPGRVLVKWRSPAAARLHSTKLVFNRAIAADRALVATEPTRAATLAMVDQLNADPDVEYAEPDYIRTRSSVPMTPSDPLYPKQWALPMIDAPMAWGAGYLGSPSVTVAIIDTGYVAHPELAGRIVDTTGYDFISDPANAADGDGRDGDPTDTGDSTDQSSALHGTHVAGIIAADSNNGVGVAGLDWGCRLLIVRALGVSRGTGVDSDISDAIRWAAGLHVDGVPDNQHPADVINMSFGGAGYSQSMQDAIHDAVAAGSIVVAAAGNLAVDAKGDSPAGLDGVITVGAVDMSGQIAAYSNYGSVVALMAPGGSPQHDPATGAPLGVLSTIELVGSGFTYTYYAGTSQATPFVSAAVSLMRAVHPHMAAPEARRILQATANASGQCADPNDPTLQGCGAGLLDVDAAVAMAAAAGDDPIGSRLGNVVHSGYGCAIAPTSSGAAPLAGVAFALVALALVRRRRTRAINGA